MAAIPMQLFAITKRNYHIFKANQIKAVKIARLQRRWRKRQARRLLYEPLCIEPVSKRPYWHNPNCNSIRWKKIKWLRRMDVRTVIELPDPDIEFVKLCDQCNDLTVSFYCVDCDDFYCESCYDSFHGKGKEKEPLKVFYRVLYRMRISNWDQRMPPVRRLLL